MKLDDLLNYEDDDADGPLDDIILKQLAAFGFTHVTYRLSRVVAYIGVITGYRADGSSHRWQGVGKTPEEAETDTIDELAKWLMQQQVL